MWIPTPSNGEISLYFHLPFCKKKCDYCHFFVLPDSKESQAKLLDALLLEISQKSPLFQNKPLASVYFGGGTPSLVSPDFIDQILNKVASITSLKDVEVTLEMNPENHDLDKLKSFLKAGINRISLGGQTFDDVLLKKIGRTHHSKDTTQAILNAHKANFSNISLDLMYDLPEQDMNGWVQTLNLALELPIQHISLYNLSLEPRSLFYKYRQKIRAKMPSAQLSLEMFQKAQELFHKKKFNQYEISAFCKDQKYSKHNVGYWLQRPHLGFGPSAYSFWQKKRFQNIAHFNQYCQKVKNKLDPLSFEETLKPSEHLRESLALHLRLTAGFNLQVFQKRFGILPASIQKTLKKLVEEKLAIEKEATFKLSAKGLLYHDAIASEII